MGKLRSYLDICARSARSFWNETPPSGFPPQAVSVDVDRLVTDGGCVDHGSTYVAAEGAMTSSAAESPCETLCDQRCEMIVSALPPLACAHAGSETLYSAKNRTPRRLLSLSRVVRGTPARARRRRTRAEERARASLAHMKSMIYDHQTGRRRRGGATASIQELYIVGNDNWATNGTSCRGGGDNQSRRISADVHAPPRGAAPRQARRRRRGRAESQRGQQARDSTAVGWQETLR